MTQETIRAIVNFFAFFSKIMRAALTLSVFYLATRSLSNAATVRACACFDSSLATSTACSNHLNLAITIDVVAVPRVQQMLVSNHLKNLHARSSSCTIQYNTWARIQRIDSLKHNTNILPILGYGTYWWPIATTIKPPTKCMKFQGRPNDTVVNVTKMAIKTGEIVTRFWHWHIFLLRNKNRG